MGPRFVSPHPAGESDAEVDEFLECLRGCEGTGFHAVSATGCETLEMLCYFGSPYLSSL